MKRNIETLKNMKLVNLLSLLVWARTSGSASQSEFNDRMTLAYEEAKKAGFPEMLLIVVSHIGDVSRYHNMYKELNISVGNGGTGNYRAYRKMLNWLISVHPEMIKDYYKYAHEFTQYSIGWYYQNTTDRKKGSLKSTEILFFPKDEVFAEIREKLMLDKDVALIAKQLPKYTTGKYRYSTNKNGEKVRRPIKDFTIKKRSYVNAWIAEFAEAMRGTPYFEFGTIAEYKEFRKLQSSVEQLTSSQVIDTLSDDELYKLFDHCPAKQRMRLHKILMRDSSKFPNASRAYKEWMAIQVKAASMTKEERKEAGVKLTVKSTGMNTAEILQRMVKTSDEDEADVLWKSLIEKQDHTVSIFPVIDGSGSMSSYLNEYPSLTRRDVAYALAITFATQNPSEYLKNSYGWFSKNFHVINHIDYKMSGETFWSRKMVKTRPYQVISDKYSFTQNMANMRMSDSEEISYTDQTKVIEFFVNKVKRNELRIEELPQVILYITDNEFNGRGLNAPDNVKYSQELASSIGWYPLQVFWGIVMNSDQFPFKDLTNVIGIGGFNEGVLNQIFRNIKNMYVDPYTELWSIIADKRYSMLAPSKLIGLANDALSKN